MLKTIGIINILNPQSIIREIVTTKNSMNVNIERFFFQRREQKKKNKLMNIIVKPLRPSVRSESKTVLG